MPLIPSSPVAPVYPWTPVGPVDPVTPVSPEYPRWPVTPRSVKWNHAQITVRQTMMANCMKLQTSKGEWQLIHATDQIIKMCYNAMVTGNFSTTWVSWYRKLSDTLVTFIEVKQISNGHQMSCVWKNHLRESKTLQLYIYIISLIYSNALANVLKTTQTKFSIYLAVPRNVMKKCQTWQHTCKILFFGAENRVPWQYQRTTGMTAIQMNKCLILTNLCIQWVQEGQMHRLHHYLLLAPEHQTHPWFHYDQIILQCATTY